MRFGPNQIHGCMIDYRLRNGSRPGSDSTLNGKEQLSSVKMEKRESSATASASASSLEDAKIRCAALSDRIQRLSASKLSLSPKTTLCRLINSELIFLRRLSASPDPSTYPLRFLFAVIRFMSSLPFCFHC